MVQKTAIIAIIMMFLYLAIECSSNNPDKVCCCLMEILINPSPR